MWRQTTVTFPASATFDHCQIILLDDRGKLPHKIHLFTSHSCKKSFTAWTTANIRAHISVCVSVNTWTKTTPRTFTRIVRVSVNWPLHYYCRLKAYIVLTFLDCFRNKSGKPQPILTKVGIQAQLKGQQIWLRHVNRGWNADFGQKQVSKYILTKSQAICAESFAEWMTENIRANISVPPVWIHGLQPLWEHSREIVRVSVNWPLHY